MRKKKETKPTSFRLPASAKDLLAKMADKLEISQAAVLVLAIHRIANDEQEATDKARAS